MTSFTTYMILMLLFASSGIVLSRPQEDSGKMGSFIGELVVSSGNLAVARNANKKNGRKPEKTDKLKEKDSGPSFSRFITGPELTPSSGAEISFEVGSPAGGNVAVSSGPGFFVSDSGPVLTFNNEAQIVAVSA